MQSGNPSVVQRTCLEVRRRFQQFAPENTIDQFDGSGWSLIVARNPFVPYATSVDSNGLAVVIGSTFAPEGPTVADLRTKQAALRIQSMHEFCRLLNYGVALSIEDGEFVITTDYLGLYPIYYFKDNAAFIVTSIPGVLECYSGFHSTIDIKGLVGILLLAHGILGRTLFSGVTRLNPGSLLKYTLDGRATQEKVAMSVGSYSPKNIDEAIEAFDSAMSNVIGAATCGTASSILLSGGLDSRIVAGYLRKHAKGELTAVTLGDPKDFEIRGAARVASAIGANHERIPVTQADIPIYAQRALDTDALSSGFYALHMWSLAEKPGPPILTGFQGDSIIGGSHINWGREPAPDLHTFHAMFTQVNSWGLSPGVVRELVRADDIDDIILDVVCGLRDEYYSYPGEPWQRSWWFDLHHRQRILVGRVPKLIAMRSWPVLPYTYPAVLALAFATPLSLLAERGVQRELIRRKFLPLARLRFAGNVAPTWLSIMPRRSGPWTPYLDRMKDSIVRHMFYRKDTIDRRRFAVRMFDFNGEGWKALRDQARARALGVDTWFNKDLVMQLIPPSSTQVKFNLPISEATGRRTLIGAVLCCSQYFAVREGSVHPKVR